MTVGGILKMGHHYDGSGQSFGKKGWVKIREKGDSFVHHDMSDTLTERSFLESEVFNGLRVWHIAGKELVQFL